MKNLQDICKKLIHDFIPSESAYFDSIWENYLRIIEIKPLEDHTIELSPNDKSSRVFNIGAGGAGGGILSLELITPLMIVATRLEQGQNKNLSYEQINDMLIAEAMAMNVSTETLSIIQDHAVPMLARKMAVLLPDNAGFDNKNIFMVDWFEASEESSTYGHNRQKFDITVVQDRFRNNNKNFALFVDEAIPLITVNKSDDDLWPKLGTGHLGLLGMILSSLRTRRPLSFSEIASEALGYQYTYDSAPSDTSVRRCLSELNSKLKGVLKSVIKAERGMRKYAPHGNIEYCWIRPADGSSRLSKDTDF